jgi:hypothetical protein
MSHSTITDDENDFGSYLVTVEERDIDLLLMEEFHVSHAFVSRFCERLGYQEVTFAGAWHSVSDADGQTDLLLRVRIGNRRIGILIENKIKAPEQHEQDARYHIRAVRAQQEGKFEEFVTSICAPQVYLNGLPDESLYQHRIPYEAIAEWFSQLEGPRHSWRHRIMREAIGQGRRGYTMVVSQTNSEFHMAYWEYLRRKHPRLLMQKPKPKGKKSNWIIMKGIGFPKGVQVHHKIDQRVVELGFNRRTVSDILAVQSDWPDGITPDQKKGTAVLSISVPLIDMSKKVTAQHDDLELVFAAIYRLLPYARILETASNQG